MRNLSSLLGGLARSLHVSSKKQKTHELQGGEKEAVEAMAKQASKSNRILRSSGSLKIEGSSCFVSVHSRRGEKGINQDCTIVWEKFGCQEDAIFCGVFDGHGAWGHYVSKRVRDSLPSSLLCNWRFNHEAPERELLSEKSQSLFDQWKQSFLSSCAVVDKELEKNASMDAHHSGTTALAILKQGDLLVVANVGDSRAVLASMDETGSLAPVQLTVDFRPNLPQERERILRCNGRVFCMEDEEGVARLWLPNDDSPGLAMSRAFGDHCAKGFGLVSLPEVTQRSITGSDQFVILATDGVWDVVSNQEAISIVSSTLDPQKAAKRLVEYAVQMWRRKRKNIALDDCSAICLFFGTPSS